MHVHLTSICSYVVICVYNITLSHSTNFTCSFICSNFTFFHYTLTVLSLNENENQQHTRFKVGVHAKINPGVPAKINPGVPAKINVGVHVETNC